MMRPYHRYLSYGPARPVPRLLFMPFPGHRDMAEVIAAEKRSGKCEQDNEDNEDRDEPA